MPPKWMISAHKELIYLLFWCQVKQVYETHLKNTHGRERKKRRGRRGDSGYRLISARVRAKKTFCELNCHREKNMVTHKHWGITQWSSSFLAADWQMSDFYMVCSPLPLCSVWCTSCCFWVIVSHFTTAKTNNSGLSSGGNIWWWW